MQSFALNPKLFVIPVNRCNLAETAHHCHGVDEGGEGPAAGLPRVPQVL